VLGAPAGGVEAPLWRAVAVFRWASAAYACTFILLGLDSYRRPWLALVVLSALLAWTAVATVLYTEPARRRWPLLTADLAVSTALLLTTALVETRPRIDDGAPTLTLSWVAAALLAWAVRHGPAGGLAAAVVLGAANVVLKEGRVGQATVNSIVLLVLLGVIIGLVVRLALRAEARLAEAVRREAATAERERLARRIHDEVLQVLALVQRRGAEIGGSTAELGRLAGEQEAALRALVGAAPAVPSGAATPGGGADEPVLDLVALLAGHASSRVSLSAPATPVSLPAHTARELAAAVAAALDNVACHAGDGARAWVLVEDEGDEVVVSVRDDGPGIPPGRLQAAEAAGRLGVAQSMCGRVRDLGGTTTVTAPPGSGTEVEFRVPR
jgi:signal transduction histidine kinase